MCHEFRYDGGESPARSAKGKVIRTGYYSRIFLPAQGSVTEQDNLTMQVLDSMRDYYHHKQYLKIKR